MKPQFFGVRTVRGAEHLAVPGLKPTPAAVPKARRPRSPRKKKQEDAAKPAEQDSIFVDAASVATQEVVATAGFAAHQEVDPEQPDMVRFFDLAEEDEQLPL
jgi:hypothetical protein